jgi:FtsH-binding integral membrane protein
MKENEKNLFYRVLSNNIKEEPAQELVSNIMHTVHKTVKKRIIMHKIFEIAGYSLLGVLSLGFVCVYLFFYTNFKLPALHISFVMPSKIYIIILSIVFCFSLIQLYFRQQLYKNYN